MAVIIPPLQPMNEEEIEVFAVVIVTMFILSLTAQLFGFKNGLIELCFFVSSVLIGGFLFLTIMAAVGYGFIGACKWFYKKFIKRGAHG